MRAHAILHRANREQDEDGHLLATVDGDYAPVRLLVGDVIAESVEASVTPAMSETVEAVQELLDEGREHVSAKALVDQSRRRPLGHLRPDPARPPRGYLTNEAGENERGYKLTIGSPSRRRGLLPSPAEVVRVLSGRAPGQRNADPMKVPRRLSGSPGRPVDPPEIEVDEDRIDTEPGWLKRGSRLR